MGMFMHQIVLQLIIGKFCFHFNIIMHQYFHQLIGGLRIQLLVTQIFSSNVLKINIHYQIVAHLFMHLMGQLILHLLTVLMQEHLHLHLMLYIGEDV